MTFTATPQPSNAPPRVRLDIDSDDAGASFTSLSVTRDGALIREQPFVGGPEALTFDYEAPFGVPVTYDVTGSFLPSQTPDWTESWASLAAWTGDTADYSVSGGKARSSVTNADITRTVSGTIQRVDVTDPSYMRVELLSAADAVIASVQVGANVIVTGTTSTAVAGSGSFTATLVSGTLSVQAVDSSWSASRPYVGVPTKVRLVSLGVSYPLSQLIATSSPTGVAVDSAGNVYVLDSVAKLVRRYNSSGVAGITWSTVGSPKAIAVDASDNIYVLDGTNALVRKFTSLGVAGLTFATFASTNAIVVDSAGSIYVLDPSAYLVRKYSSTGVAGITFSTVGLPIGLAVDASNNIYTVDFDAKRVRKFTSAGAVVTSFVVAGTYYAGLTVDASGNVFVVDSGDNLIRKYSSAGVAGITIPTWLGLTGIAKNAAGDIYVTSNGGASYVLKYVATTPSVGAIAPALAVSEQPFLATATVTLDVDEAWLIHPSQPSLSASIDPGTAGIPSGLTYVEASSGETKQSQATRAVHYPVGRTKGVVVTHGSRAADDWTLVLTAPTFVIKDNLRALLDDQTPLLLRTNGTPEWNQLPDGWYSVGDLELTRVDDPLVTQATILTLPLTPVDEPIVRQGALWTYGGDLILNATYADSRAMFPTYLDRLAGPES